MRCDARIAPCTHCHLCTKSFYFSTILFAYFKLRIPYDRICPDPIFPLFGCRLCSRIKYTHTQHSFSTFLFIFFFSSLFRLFSIFDLLLSFHLYSSSAYILLGLAWYWTRTKVESDTANDFKITSNVKWKWIPSL